MNLIEKFLFKKFVKLSVISSLSFKYTELIIKLSVISPNFYQVYDIPKWKDEVYDLIRQIKIMKLTNYSEDFFFGLLENTDDVKRYIEDSCKDLTRKGYSVSENVDYHKIYLNHYVFVDRILENFADIDYDQTMKLLDAYIVGSGKQN